MYILRSAIITVGYFGEDQFGVRQYEALSHEIDNDDCQSSYLQIHIDDSYHQNHRKEAASTGNRLNNCVVHSPRHGGNGFNSASCMGDDAIRQIKRTCRLASITLILVREQCPNDVLAAIQIAEFSQGEDKLTLALLVGSKQGENAVDNAQPQQEDCRHVCEQLDKLTSVVVQISDYYSSVSQKNINPIVKCIQGLLFPLCLPGHVCVDFADYLTLFKKITCCVAFYYEKGNGPDCIAEASRKIIGNIKRKEKIVTVTRSIFASFTFNSTVGLKDYLRGSSKITAEDLWLNDETWLICSAALHEHLGHDGEVMLFCFR
jgi:hypothetical protein